MTSLRDQPGPFFGDFGGRYMPESLIADIPAWVNTLTEVREWLQGAGVRHRNSAVYFPRLEIPDALNTIASYPIAPVADSRNPGLAQAYIDFVLSPEGQAILSDYGFLPAGTP